MSTVPELFKLFGRSDGVHIVAVERESCRVYEFITAPLSEFFECFLKHGGCVRSLDVMEEVLREMFSASSREGFVHDLCDFCYYRQRDLDDGWLLGNAALRCHVPASRALTIFEQRHLMHFTIVF